MYSFAKANGRFLKVRMMDWYVNDIYWDARGGCGIIFYRGGDTFY